MRSPLLTSISRASPEKVSFNIAGDDSVAFSEAVVEGFIVAAINHAGGKLSMNLVGALYKKLTSKKLNLTLTNFVEMINQFGKSVDSAGETFIFLQSTNRPSYSTVEALMMAAIRDNGGKLSMNFAGDVYKMLTSKKLKELLRGNTRFVKIINEGEAFICLQSAHSPSAGHDRRSAAGVKAEAMTKKAVKLKTKAPSDSTVEARMMAALKDAGRIYPLSGDASFQLSVNQAQAAAVTAAMTAARLAMANLTTSSNSSEEKSPHPPSASSPVPHHNLSAAATLPLVPLEYQIIGPISSPDHPSFKEMLHLLHNTVQVLAIDCEMSKKQICLLQLAALDIGSGAQKCFVYLLDMAEPEAPGSSSNESQASMMLKPLRGFLEDKRILKVFHDSREVSPPSVLAFTLLNSYMKPRTMTLLRQ